MVLEWHPVGLATAQGQGSLDRDQRHHGSRDATTRAGRQRLHGRRPGPPVVGAFRGSSDGRASIANPKEVVTVTTQTVLGGEGLSGAPLDVRSLVGSVLAERYELYSVLGRGGTGIVMAARDRTLGSDVAIKVLRPELASDRRWIERLSREVKVARQLHHPNVCPAFDLERADGHAFIVMPLAAGSLRGELSGQGAARPLEDRLRDAAGFAAGLAASTSAESCIATSAARTFFA